MRHRQDDWNLVPVWIALGGLAVAGALAGLGLLFPPLMALAVVIYGSVAIGLMLYGWFCSVVEPFKVGVWHGIACLLFPAIYPVYFSATHGRSDWKPLVNLMLGFGLIWVAVQTFPMFRNADAKPARPLVAGGDPLDAIGPPRGEPEAPGTAQLTATTRALAKLLAKVTDEATARKAAPRFQQLMAQRRSDFDAAGEPRALDDRGKLVSISAVIKLGPHFRDANREFEKQWKRVRAQGALSKVLEGAR